MTASLIASACVVLLLVLLLRAVRALWEDQYRDESDSSYRRAAWIPMILLLCLFGGALANYGWQAVQVHAPNQHPALQVSATCEKGVWTFAAEGRIERVTRDLRLRGGRDVRLRLKAGNHATEFFVPGLGLKKRLDPNELATLSFRPPSPTGSDEAALYRSVCLHHCRGKEAVRPFLVVIEAPRGILAF